MSMILMLTVSICQSHAHDADSTAIINYDYSLADIGIDTDAGSLIAEYPEPKVPNRIGYYWIDMLKAHRLDVNDTSIHYPKFINFCLNIYRWAEKTFNTYDPEYVSGTGKHGKIRLVSDNWADTYYFRMPEGIPLTMMSSPSTNLGIAANYSILSASYSVNPRTLFTGVKSKFTKMQFAFTCARLYGEVYFWKNSGSTGIRFVGKESLIGRPNSRFDGVHSKELGLMGLYIINSRKFSLAAAYNLSNYQLKSAGSPILGISSTFYDSLFDFDKLPQDVKDKVDLPFSKYKIECNSFDLVAGYSFNWVLNRHFLFNVSALPGLGLTFTYQSSTIGQRCLLSMLVRGQLSLTYTNRQFFIAMAGTYRGNTILTNDIRSMSGVGNIQISTGIRF